MKIYKPTLIESIMIGILLFVVWTAWGQFQFQNDECCDGNTCKQEEHEKNKTQ